MFVIYDIDSRGNRYPSNQNSEEDARTNFDRPIYGRFVRRELFKDDVLVASKDK